MDFLAYYTKDASMVCGNLGRQGLPLFCAQKKRGVSCFTARSTL